MWNGLPVLLLAACVSVPRQDCTPVAATVREASYYRGRCAKLVYRDEDLTNNCWGELVMYDLDPKTRRALFFTDEPRERIGFEGVPFSVDPKSQRFEVKFLTRGERQLLLPRPPEDGGGEKGACQFFERDSQNFLLKCETKDREGHRTLAEFATERREGLRCREDFPEVTHGRF